MTDDNKLLEISYDQNELDIMNGVNYALYINEIGFQFVLHDEDQDDDLPSLFYRLDETEDYITE